MIKRIIQKIKIIFVPTKENNFRPKFLESQVLFYCVIVLIVLKLFTIPFFLYFPKNVFFATIVKNTLIELVNKERQALGYPSLKENPKLEKAAFLKAQDILEKDYFSHYSPEGKSPWYWFKMAGYDYKLAGENLAIGFLDSEEVHQAWLNSPTHRQNLLNPNYQEIGIAIVKGEFQGNETHVVVQLFGQSVLPKKPKEKPLTGQPLTQEKFLTQQKPSLPEKSPIQKEEASIKKEILPKEDPSAFEELDKELQKPSFQGPQEEIQKPQPETQPTPPSAKIVSFETPKEKLNFSLLSFLASDYYRFLQKFIYGFLFLIIFSLLINIFVRFDIQHPDLIFKALGFIFLLIIFLLIDKLTLIKFIPHNFSIY